MHDPVRNCLLHRCRFDVISTKITAIPISIQSLFITVAGSSLDMRGLHQVEIDGKIDIKGYSSAFQLQPANDH